MLKKYVKLIVLGALLNGLCASAQTNTTTPDSAISNNAEPSPNAAPAQQRPHLIRMVLLLPLGSPTLAASAEAVRAGVFAAYERDNLNVTVDVIKTGEMAQNLVPAYAEAIAEFDIVIGPLSRDDVAAVAQSGNVKKPTIALAQPDGSSGDEVIFPQNMLMMGLSAEDEAHQVATWTAADKKTGQAFIVSTNTPWQRRAAKAFAEEWQARGLTLQSSEIAMFEGYLSASSLTQVKTRIQAEKPAFVFAALDAAQTSQLRMMLGNEPPIYGTSQLNALTLSDRKTSAPTPEMNGVRLIDIPWQLQPDHLAVMSYPPLPLKESQKSSADLERLYALGIDAYRVAKEIAAQNTNFKIDGVTGTLTVSFGKGVPSFKRMESTAIFRHGSLTPFGKDQ